MSRNACSSENGETGEESQATGDLNWIRNVNPWRLTILAKLAIFEKIARGLALIAINYRKVASLWRFEMDATDWPLGGW